MCLYGNYFGGPSNSRVRLFAVGEYSIPERCKAEEILATTGGRQNGERFSARRIGEETTYSNLRCREVRVKNLALVSIN